MVYLHSWNGTRAPPTLTPADILPLRIPLIGAVYCTLLQLLMRKCLTNTHLCYTQCWHFRLSTLCHRDSWHFKVAVLYELMIHHLRVFPWQHILQLIKRIIFKLSKTNLLFKFCKIELQNIYFWQKLSFFFWFFWFFCCCCNAKCFV